MIVALEIEAQVTVSSVAGIAVMVVIAGVVRMKAEERSEERITISNIRIAGEGGRAEVGSRILDSSID